MTVRRSASIRIVIWLAAAIFLSAVLLFHLFGKWSIPMISFGYNSSLHYSDASRYSMGAGEFAEGKVTDLDINWVAGSITVKAYDGDTVQFYEECSKELKEEDQLHYLLRNGTLIIQYRASDRSYFSFHKEELDKSLTVLLPEKTAEQLGKLELETSSSDIWIEDVQMEKMDLESVSGSIDIQNCKMQKFDAETTSADITAEALIVKEKADIETVSGDVRLSGSFGQLQFEGISGYLECQSEICPERFDAETVSGDIGLQIPDNDGFTYEKDTVSGTMRCDFEVKERNDKAVYKDGKAKFSFETVSGDISIERWEP